MRILLATDGSDSARFALDFLVDFPFPAKSEAVVLSVIDWNAFKIEKELSDEHNRTIRKAQEFIQDETEQLLTSEGERLRSADWAGSVEIRHGDPADEIIRAAQDLEVDLVILGSHGTSGIKRFLLGSVSRRVLEYASCSVLIVKQPSAGKTETGSTEMVSGEHETRPRRRILLAYDNSEPSRKALSLCSSLPLDDRAEVTAVSVMPLVTAYRQDIRQHMNTIWQQKKHAARVALEEAMQALRWSTPHVSAVMREGANVSEEILDLAEKSETDLIVVGCKGKSAIQRFLLGSITNRIAGHAHCSVWAVRI